MGDLFFDQDEGDVVWADEPERPSRRGRWLAVLAVLVVVVVVAAGGAARFCGGDVAKDADVKRLVEFTLATYGGLHVVVNNAGTTHKNQPMLDVSEEQFDRIYQVNVKSLFLSARHVVPHFREQRDGVFITIASTAGGSSVSWSDGGAGCSRTCW